MCRGFWSGELGLLRVGYARRAGAGACCGPRRPWRHGRPLAAIPCRSRTGETRVATTLERETELDCIAAALDGAADGTGSVLVIEGHAGIGKTRLVADARALARLRSTSIEPSWMPRDTSSRDLRCKDRVSLGHGPPVHPPRFT